MIQIDGYVIVPPLSPWDEKHRDLIWADMGKGTFGTTPVEAWRRFIGTSNISHMDVTEKINYFHGRGYRLKKASMTISLDYE